MKPHKTESGFSIIELLVAMSVLSMLLLILFGTLDSVTAHYVRSTQKAEATERGRASLELVTRELTPAVVDTRMQFVVIPGERLREAGAVNIAPGSPAILWMAPLGKGGELRCVGYYLDHQIEEKKYRLKRIYIRHDNEDGYFPTLYSLSNARDLTNRTDPVSGKWFTQNWDEEAFDDITVGNDKAIVSPVADGVLGFWVQCYDTLGNPIPWMSESENHPNSDMMFNSAGYFTMANSQSFDDGSTFAYLSKTPLVYKAHRLPTEVEIGIFTSGDDAINNTEDLPPMTQVLNDSGCLDLEASVNQLKAQLEELNIRKGELLTTRVKLTNGG